ncbi:MAG: Mur ligase family protein [bacterium]
MAERSWTPAEARGWLEALKRRGMILGLERVEAVSARLGAPHQAYPSVLIAGTNGKGTVAAILDTILAGAGCRVGRYTSPHLIDWPERISVGGHPIAEPDLAASLQAVHDAAGGIEITPFEAVTLAAFWHFRKSRVDWGVVEVGLGGRLDATRICRAEVTAVTAVGRDHTRELGTDLDGIAREKGAIARRGSPLVLGPGTAPVRAALVAQARERGTRAVRSEEVVRVTGRPDTRWGLTGRAQWLDWAADPVVLGGGPVKFDWSIPLAGEHILNNITTALACVACMRKLGMRIGTEAIRDGLGSVRWPGRMQCIEGPTDCPDLLLDVGHNPLASEAAARELSIRAPGRRKALVTALADDKDVRGFLRPLIGSVSAVVTTTWPGTRARDPEEVAGTARLLRGELGLETEVLTAPDPVTAISAALPHAGPGGLVLAMGSHMLIGPVLAVLKRPEDRERLWTCRDRAAEER